MIRLLVVAMFALQVTGCAVWREIFRAQNSDDPSSLLQSSQMSPDSVVLEISIISIPADKTNQISELFDSLDVANVDLDQRKRWDQNGLRVATSGVSTPVELTKLLEFEIPTDEDEESKSEPKLAPRRRIQARSGKRIQIATRPVETELTWFMVEPDGYRHGASRYQAQTEFEIRSYSQGNGSVKLLVTPEIFFGDPKQVVTTSNSSFRYEMKRDSIRFSDLRLTSKLELGESLVLAPTLQTGAESMQQFGLGRAFFQNQNGDCKLVIVRLAQSQKDDLFDSNSASQPLESITE